MYFRNTLGACCTSHKWLGPLMCWQAIYYYFCLPWCNIAVDVAVLRKNVNRTAHAHGYSKPIKVSRASSQKKKKVYVVHLYTLLESESSVFVVVVNECIQYLNA